MKDNKGWLDSIAPEHLKSKVISGALYIHAGKDTDEKRLLWLGVGFGVNNLVKKLNEEYHVYKK